MTDGKLTILIAGFSYAGLNTVLALDKELCKKKYADKVNMVVVEPKNGFYYSVAAPRGMVDATFATRQWISLDNVVKKSRDAGLTTIKHTMLKELHEKHVICEDGSRIDFDFIVIGTGTKYAHPFKTDYKTAEEWDNAIKKTIDAVKAANRIAVVGGGPSGCEVVGELKHSYPEKEVTLIESNKLLVSRSFNEKGSKAVADKLAKMGVNIITGQRVSELPVASGLHAGEVKFTVGDKEVVTDVQIICTGVGAPNTEFAQTLKTILDERSYIKVDETCQVSGYPHMFAIGDVNNMSYAKTAMQATWQGNATVVGLMKFIDASLQSEAKLTSEQLAAIKLKNYKPQMNAMLVTTGPKGGVAQMGGFVITRFLPSFKAASYFIEKTYTSLGHKQ